MPSKKHQHQIPARNASEARGTGAKECATRRKRRRVVLALASVAALAGSTVATAGHPVSVQRLGRLLGFGWSDGYHVCRDSGLRPGADLPPQSYPDQFGPKKAKKPRGTCGEIYPAGTALPPPSPKRHANRSDCDSGPCQDAAPSQSFSVPGPSSHSRHFVPQSHSSIPPTAAPTNTTHHAHNAPTAIPSAQVPAEAIIEGPSVDLDQPQRNTTNASPALAETKQDTLFVGPQQNTSTPPQWVINDPATSAPGNGTLVDETQTEAARNTTGARPLRLPPSSEIPNDPSDVVSPSDQPPSIEQTESATRGAAKVKRLPVVEARDATEDNDLLGSDLLGGDSLDGDLLSGELLSGDLLSEDLPSGELPSTTSTSPAPGGAGSEAMTLPREMAVEQETATESTRLDNGQPDYLNDKRFESLPSRPSFSEAGGGAETAEENGFDTKPYAIIRSEESRAADKSLELDGPLEGGPIEGGLLDEPMPRQVPTPEGIELPPVKSNPFFPSQPQTSLPVTSPQARVANRPDTDVIQRWNPIRQPD